MRARLLGAAITAALAWVETGCEPPTVVPVAPPGLEYQPMLPERPEEAAEAIGETRGTLDRSTTSAQAPAPATPTKPGESKTTASGLTYQTLKEGTGEPAAWGKTVAVHYVGTLTNGTEFDNSRKRGQPLTVLLGSGHVIRGWEEGIQGMKVGEVRKLTIPPDLAYGTKPPANSPIPPNATLVFEVELTDVR